MRSKSVFGLFLATCMCFVSAPAMAAGTDDSKGALRQLKAVEKTSKEAARDAKAANLGDAKAKAGTGFDTPSGSTETVKQSTGTVKAEPLKQEDAKAVAKRENEAQKTRDRETAKKYKLDDRKKAPPPLK